MLLKQFSLINRWYKVWKTEIEMDDGVKNDNRDFFTTISFAPNEFWLIWLVDSPSDAKDHGKN